MEQEIRKGHGELHCNHVVIMEQEAAEKALNPPNEEGKRKTRIAWDAGDPDSYAAWHAERERWMIAAKKNPTLATDAMIVALKAYSQEGMEAILEALGSLVAGRTAPNAAQTETVPGVVRATLPEWVPPEDSLKR